jgi:hypothetical protein
MVVLHRNIVKEDGIFLSRRYAPDQSGKHKKSCRVSRPHGRQHFADEGFVNTQCLRVYQANGMIQNVPKIPITKCKHCFVAFRSASSRRTTCSRSASSFFLQVTKHIFCTDRITPRCIMADRCPRSDTIPVATPEAALRTLQFCIFFSITGAHRFILATVCVSHSRFLLLL